MKRLSKGLLTLSLLVFFMVTCIVPIYSQGAPLGEPFKVGVLGVMSGHAAMLGMVASYQSAPIIYKYLMENSGVKTISFVARNQPDPLNQRKEGIAAAQKLGLKIISSDVTYEPETADFFPIMTKALQEKPDLLVLSGVSPGDAPLLLKTARQLGYEGHMSSETSFDMSIFAEVAGEYTEGYICTGGGSVPEIRSDYMNKFMEAYEEIAGEWNDEAGTKVYALPMIIYTIQQAGKAALTDVEVFKDAIPSVKVDDPFVKGEYSRTLEWVGESYFGQNHQIGVPIVITQIKDGEPTALFVGSVVD